MSSDSSRIGAGQPRPVDETIVGKLKRKAEDVGLSLDSIPTKLQKTSAGRTFASYFGLKDRSTETKMGNAEARLTTSQPSSPRESVTRELRAKLAEKGAETPTMRATEGAARRTLDYGGKERPDRPLPLTPGLPKGYRGESAKPLPRVDLAMRGGKVPDQPAARRAVPNKPLPARPVRTASAPPRMGETRTPAPTTTAPRPRALSEVSSAPREITGSTLKSLQQTVQRHLAEYDKVNNEVNELAEKLKDQAKAFKDPSPISESDLKQLHQLDQKRNELALVLAADLKQLQSTKGKSKSDQQLLTTLQSQTTETLRNISGYGGFLFKDLSEATLQEDKLATKIKESIKEKIAKDKPTLSKEAQTQECERVFTEFKDCVFSDPQRAREMVRPINPNKFAPDTTATSYATALLTINRSEKALDSFVDLKPLVQSLELQAPKNSEEQKIYSQLMKTCDQADKILTSPTRLSVAEDWYESLQTLEQVQQTLDSAQNTAFGARILYREKYNPSDPDRALNTEQWEAAHKRLAKRDPENSASIHSLTQFVVRTRDTLVEHADTLSPFYQKAGSGQYELNENALQQNPSIDRAKAQAAVNDLRSKLQGLEREIKALDIKDTDQKVKLRKESGEVVTSHITSESRDRLLSVTTGALRELNKLDEYLNR